MKKLLLLLLIVSAWLGAQPVEGLRSLDPKRGAAPHRLAHPSTPMRLQPAAGTSTFGPVYSRNWSGYVEGPFSQNHDQAGYLVANFVVPTVNCKDADQFQGSAAAAWVGFDGYNNAALEQIGIAVGCDPILDFDGEEAPYYYPWVQNWIDDNTFFTLYPSVILNPGDSIQLEIFSPAWTGVPGLFWATIYNNSNNQAWGSAVINPNGTYDYAEVIVERPGEEEYGICALTPLADFGVIDQGSDFAKAWGAVTWSKVAGPRTFAPIQVGSFTIPGTGANAPITQIIASDLQNNVVATPSPINPDGRSWTTAWSGYGGFVGCN